MEFDWSMLHCVVVLLLQMSTGKRAALVIALVFAVSGTFLAMAGIASLQNLCWKDNVAATNSRKLLAVDTSPITSGLFASCSKTFR